jgi:hypothetical protein
MTKEDAKEIGQQVFDLVTSKDISNHTLAQSLLLGPENYFMLYRNAIDDPKWIMFHALNGIEYEKGDIKAIRSTIRVEDFSCLVFLNSIHDMIYQCCGCWFVNPSVNYWCGNGEHEVRFKMSDSPEYMRMEIIFKQLC